MNSAELQRWISTLRHPGNMVIMKYSHNTTQNGGRLHEEHYAASSKRDTDICGRGLPYKKNEELQKVHSRSICGAFKAGAHYLEPPYEL